MGPCNLRAATVAVALAALLAAASASARTPFDHLRLERGAVANGETEYRLGANAFTTAQLVSFLGSIERFLALADGLPEGDRVTLHQAGKRGYIAITAYESADAPLYVLTLAAEEPTGIVTRSGLEALWVLLVEQIDLTQSAAGGSPADLSLATP